MKTIDVGITDTNVKTSILEHGFRVQSIERKILGNIYEPKVVLEDNGIQRHITNINKGVL
jgi:hypothetical protein